MFNVIYALFFRELKTRFGRNRRLGYAWVIGEPMAQISVILVVVTIIREYQHRVMPNDIPIFMFLACGIIPFFMFRNTITQLMNGIDSNLGLFAYKPVKPIHVLIARACLEFCIYFVVFLGLMLLAGWFFKMPVIPQRFLESFFCFWLLSFSGFCFGLCLTIVGHLLPTLKSLLNYIHVAIYVASAVIFPLWVIPETLLDILLYNPILHITETLKMNYIENYYVTEGINLLYPIAFNFILLFAGLWFYFYKRQELMVGSDV